MRAIEDVSEGVVIAEFLRGEWRSKRFADKLKKVVSELGLATKVVQHPNTADAEDNKRRRLIMVRFRGWGMSMELFEHFPGNVTRHEVELTGEDVSSLCAIDYSYWNEMSNGSRKVSDVAGAVRQGRGAFGVPNDNFFSAAEAWVSDGINSKIILVGKSLHGPFVVLEGHVRAVSFVLAGGHAPSVIRVYVGTSKELDQWMKLP